MLCLDLFVLVCVLFFDVALLFYNSVAVLVVSFGVWFICMFDLFV